MPDQSNKGRHANALPLTAAEIGIYSAANRWGDVLSACAVITYSFFSQIGNGECMLTVVGKYILNIVNCLYCRASEHGNIEALIKLGVAYLYNEGCKFSLPCLLAKFACTNV